MLKMPVHVKTFVILPTFVAFIFVLMPHTYARAQSADGASGADPSVATSSDASGDRAAQQSATEVSSMPEDANVATSTPAAEISPARPTSVATPTPAIAPPQTPNTTSEVMTEVAPTPSVAPSAPIAPVAPTPIVSSLPSVPESSTTEPAPSNIPALLLSTGVVLLALLGPLVLQRVRKEKNTKRDPCGKLKKELEQQQFLYEQAAKKLSLQEILVASLQKKITDVEGAVKAEAMERAKAVAGEIKDIVLEKEKSGKLTEVVHAAEDAKEAYDELVTTYEDAKKLLDALKKIAAGQGDAVHKREVAYKVCIQGVALESQRGEGAATPILDVHAPRRLRGTIVENSLHDKRILENLKVDRTWQDEDWTLHNVSVTKDEALAMQKELAEGPWYVHFWDPKSDEVIIVFKNKVFYISRSDKKTWKEAVAFGLTLGIPEDQLDFLFEEPNT